MANPEPNASARIGELDPIGVLRRRWNLLLLGMTFGVCLSLLYYFATPSQYESSIEILIGQRSSELTNSGTINGGSGENVNANQLSTHTRLLVARKVLADAIRRGDLNHYETFQRLKREGESPIDHIIDHLVVQRGGDGKAADAMVLRVSYTAEDPDEAAMVLTSVYDAYKAYIDSQDQDKTQLAVELIDAARHTHEQELVQADQTYRQYMASVPVLIEGDKIKDVHKERLAVLEQELSEVRSSHAEASSRLSVINSALANSDNRVDVRHLALLSQKEIGRLKFFLDMTRGGTRSEEFQAAQPERAEVARAQYSRLLDLVQREKALSDLYGAGHPMVESARKETEVAKLFIEDNRPDDVQKQPSDLEPAEMVATYIKLLENDISELDKRKALLMIDTEREMMLAKQIENDFMKASSLKAQLQRAQTRYDQVIERLQELNLTRSYAGFSTDLLASAEATPSPVWPNLPVCLVIGGGLGCLLGLGMALVAETLDSTFHSIQDLEETVGAPVIAHVPRVRKRQLQKAAIDGSAFDASLMAYHTPRSCEAEIFRVGRTSIMMQNRAGNVRSMMVTSPQPGDGKSTTISNIAISFAQTGRSVLLIDADMRRPVIGKLFGLTRQPGLSDFLSGRSTLREVRQPSEMKGLHVIPAGGETSEPAELLGSAKFAAMIEEAKRHYDLVLIDAPPLLAVTDPGVIAPMVDSVLLTVRVIKNGRNIVRDAVRILRDIQIEPSAVVVNGVEAGAMKTYGTGRYGKNSYAYVGKYHSEYAASEAPTSDRRPSPHRPEMAAHGHETATNVVPAPAAGRARPIAAVRTAVIGHDPARSA